MKKTDKLQRITFKFVTIITRGPMDEDRAEAIEEEEVDIRSTLARERTTKLERMVRMRSHCSVQSVYKWVCRHISVKLHCIHTINVLCITCTNMQQTLLLHVHMCIVFSLTHFYGLSLNIFCVMTSWFLEEVLNYYCSIPCLFQEAAGLKVHWS